MNRSIELVTVQRRRSNGQESRVTDGAFRACLVAKRCVVMNVSDAPCYRRLPHTDIQLHSTLPWRHKYEHRFEYSTLTNYGRSFIITRSRESTSTRHERIYMGKGGGTGTNPLLLNVGTKQSWVISLMSRPLYTWRNARYTLNTRFGGPCTTGVDALERRKISCLCQVSSQSIT